MGIKKKASSQQKEMSSEELRLLITERTRFIQMNQQWLTENNLLKQEKAMIRLYREARRHLRIIEKKARKKKLEDKT